MVNKAKQLARTEGWVPVRYCIEATRYECRVKIPNVTAPAFARILDQTVPELRGRIRMHRSMVDGFVGGGEDD